VFFSILKGLPFARCLLRRRFRRAFVLRAARQRAGRSAAVRSGSCLVTRVAWRPSRTGGHWFAGLPWVAAFVLGAVLWPSRSRHSATLGHAPLGAPTQMRISSGARPWSTTQPDGVNIALVGGRRGEPVGVRLGRSFVRIEAGGVAIGLAGAGCSRTLRIAVPSLDRPWCSQSSAVRTAYVWGREGRISGIARGGHRRAHVGSRSPSIGSSLPLRCCARLCFSGRPSRVSIILFSTRCCSC